MLKVTVDILFLPNSNDSIVTSYNVIDDHFLMYVIIDQSLRAVSRS